DDYSSVARRLADHLSRERTWLSDRMPPISNVYDRPNIVVIGDANTFGLGVADGEEFSALLNNALGTEASVVNLGVPGWGLTSEIRAYYEFGRLFDPEDCHSAV